MSTDYMAACRSCRVFRHLGQDMGGKKTLGYGSNDTQGIQDSIDFLFRHAGCEGDLVVALGDVATDRPEDDYPDAEQLARPRRRCCRTNPVNGHDLCATCLEAKRQHGKHGRGDPESGPDDPDCPCRRTKEQAACAVAGCGFCIAALPDYLRTLREGR